MPVPPMGFSPSRPIPPAERNTLSDAPALLWLSYRRTLSASPLRAGCLGATRPGERERRPKSASAPTLHFRASIPASVRTHRRRFRPTDRPRPSWGSSSLGGSPSPPQAHPEAYPLTSFTLAAHARANAAPQGHDDEEIGLTPSSLPPLPRFCHLIVEPRSTQRGLLPPPGLRVASAGTRSSSLQRSTAASGDTGTRLPIRRAACEHALSLQERSTHTGDRRPGLQRSLPKCKHNDASRRNAPPARKEC
jgi:hypothetical protein